MKTAIWWVDNKSRWTTPSGVFLGGDFVRAVQEDVLEAAAVELLAKHGFGPGAETIRKLKEKL